MRGGERRGRTRLRRAAGGARSSSSWGGCRVGVVVDVLRTSYCLVGGGGLAGSGVRVAAPKIGGLARPGPRGSQVTSTVVVLLVDDFKTSAYGANFHARHAHDYPDARTLIYWAVIHLQTVFNMKERIAFRALTSCTATASSAAPRHTRLARYISTTRRVRVPSASIRTWRWIGNSRTTRTTPKSIRPKRSPGHELRRLRDDALSHVLSNPLSSARGASWGRRTGYAKRGSS
jgi:hypothetical protein